MSIFKDNAPLYWQRQLPAIPLMKGQKRPIVQRWQMYADRMVEPEEQAAWLAHYAENNIGMPMGAASGLVAVDIDIDDDEVIRALNDILPPTPWVRKGAKGMVRIYRYTNERTTRLKDTDSRMICEILSKGTQIVLPPSIHPDTGMPYQANMPLWEAVDSGKIQTLPFKPEEEIRDALRAIGVDVQVGMRNGTKTVAFVPAGARDNTMVYMAGLLSRGIVRGERTLLEAIGEIEAWVTNFTQKVVGDDVTVDKARAKLVEFLVRDVRGENKRSLPPGWDEGLTDEDKERLGIDLDRVDEAWNGDRIMEYLSEQFAKYQDPQSSGWIQSVAKALDRLASAGDEISQLEEHRIVRFIVTQSQGTLNQAAVMKEIRDLRAGEIAGEDHTELAQQMIKLIEPYGELRHEGSHFWQWRGAYWEKVEDISILKRIAVELGFYKAARRQSDHTQILRLMSTICSKPLRAIATRGLNFANGFLLPNGALVDHAPDHGATYVLPHRYLPELAGHMPMFNQFLHDCWGADPDYMDKVSALQEAIGATLFADATTYQRAFLLVGKAGTGKSRIPQIVRGLLPEDTVSSVAPHDWGHRFRPAAMYAKLMNWAGELSENKAIPGDVFKQIVEGSAITGENKGQDPFEFTVECAQWFASNHLPKTLDSSAGFTRRWLVWEFTHRVDPAKRIVDLDQIILEHEAEAIIAWAVQGYQRLLENGDYTMSASHLAVVEQIALDNNSVRYFLTASPVVTIGQGGEVNSRVLHQEYWSFCIGMGMSKRQTLAEFERMMADLTDDFDFNIVAGVGGEVKFVGIKIRV